MNYPFEEITIDTIYKQKEAASDWHMQSNDHVLQPPKNVNHL